MKLSTIQGCTDVLQAIAKHYDFSPRLLAVMSTDPVRPTFVPNVGKSRSSLLRRARLANRSRKGREHSIDLEKSYDGNSSLQGSIPIELEPLQDMVNHYQIAQDVWHWSSVDWGRRCLSAHKALQETILISL